MKRKREKKNKSGKCGANGMKNSVQISGFRRNGNPTPKFQNFCSVCALHKTLLKKQKRISDHVQGSNSSGFLKRDSIQRLMQSRQTKAKPQAHRFYLSTIKTLLSIYKRNSNSHSSLRLSFSLFIHMVTSSSLLIFYFQSRVRVSFFFLFFLLNLIFS